MDTAGPDWALWRSFAAVIADGSLSAAARRIGYSQPTLGRHIEALEQQLGLTLFERTLQGLRPTPAALRLLGPVAAAEKRLAEAASSVRGPAPEPEGLVRISAGTMLAHYVLPPILRAVRADHPRIALDLVVADAPDDLPPRMADVALRFSPPAGELAEATKLGQLGMVCCAHASYLGAHGTPLTPSDLKYHTLVGMERNDMNPKALGLALKPSDFAVRTGSATSHWELLKAGLGIGFAEAGLVGDTQGMRRLLPMLKLPRQELWLATDRELFLSPRIRVIYDRLAAALSVHLSRGTAAAPDIE